MAELFCMNLLDLPLGEKIQLSCVGADKDNRFSCVATAERMIKRDRYGREMQVVRIDNGLLSFLTVVERALDLDDLRLSGEKMSWDKTENAFLHPDSVDLKVSQGWEKGFFAAITTLGPEIFGTPDEIRSMHGTGAYSQADPKTVQISFDGTWLSLEGTVPIKGFEERTVYEKKVRICTKLNTASLIRFETTRNLTEERQPIDDGFHMQLAGRYMEEGGQYVLPVARERMLLRDSVPEEIDPLTIYPYAEKCDPIRCYQYIPERVYGLETIPEIALYSVLPEIASDMISSGLISEKARLTAEMVRNAKGNGAAYIVRSLDAFPRTLLAKRAVEEPMYAIEPCKTRPNSLRQKAIDGELQYIAPGGKSKSWIVVGFSKEEETIARIQRQIENSARVV